MPPNHNRKVRLGINIKGMWTSDKLSPVNARDIPVR